MYRYLYGLLLCITILSGCAHFPKDGLVKNIKTIAHKEHDISHGELLAKYNLLGFSGKNTCLFAKNYGDIVGNDAHNKSFIKHMSKGLQDPHPLADKAVSKINIIYTMLTDINAKYHIALKSELAHLKSMSRNVQKPRHSAFDIIGHSDNPNHHLVDLARADKLIDDVPIFMPLTTSLLTSKFGSRQLNRHHGIKIHAGIDLAASAKYANIYASANGTVLEIAASPSYGNFILIEHKKNFKTRYAHLYKLYVSRGERVFQGQLIGKQGSTGHSTNDHLHFEILHKNLPIDPMIFVEKEYSCRKTL